ncbi:OLC1v1021863C1 [Oldenlandia corymbosa var. corymbosa]|uniref:OLC1v1021863C1 n=1 Tax=Oldenlandia corymbosa var. corymbosa TaxID=529605 RepID=A0AAV1BZ98_OLDCO|nr:OLC1v1021863C1 [Oldenlandia corymbosa var. corymbosa]
MVAQIQYFSSDTINVATADPSVEKRTANYKPNIWKYGLFLQSLDCKFSEEGYTKISAQKLNQELKSLFVNVKDTLSILSLVDSISKLGLASYFQEEIKQCLNAILISSQDNSTSTMENDLYATSLCFRLLRQFGYEASQEMFGGFVNENGKFKPSTTAFKKEALVELFEASNLGFEGDNILDEARLFAMQSLHIYFDANSDDYFKEAMDGKNVLPLHWTAQWYNIKKHIRTHETEGKTNSKLLELARLNFNIVQSTHQNDLKDILRWWMDLGISEKLSFSRDRMVESFLYAGGVAYENEHGSLRKWLSKFIKLVLIIDDVYDIYGCLEDLECFTTAVDRWTFEEAKNLPQCMQKSLWTLYDTTVEISAEIEVEKGWNSVMPHLQKAWGEFCKSLLMEAKWDQKGYTPSLQEYLGNASVSSSGPLLSLLVILGVENPTSSKTVSEILHENKDLIYYISLIIRLCNDEGTSTAELERGDAPSSILCYMRESNVSEEIAREHIKSIILKIWKQINGICISKRISTPFVNDTIRHYLVNQARVAHFIYQHGDGFGEQDKKRVLSNLIEPLALN